MGYFITLENTELTDREKRILEKPKITGVVLLGRNILSYKTTKALIESIKSVRGDVRVAVDEEGGIVSRFAHLTSNYSQLYCSTLDTKRTREHYRTRSEFLKGIGVDINLAPVVDIAFNEEAYLFKRSYGSKVEKVVALSETCLEEQRKAGLMSCIKHFPGHGRTAKDSHQELPVVDITLEQWEREEGSTFEQLINFGVDYIMVGHLLFPQISEEIASVSHFWISDVLKNKLGYKGSVIADDICMEGFKNSIESPKESMFQAAGLDDLIITEWDHPFLQGLL